MSTPALARVQACVAGKSGTGISGYKNTKKSGLAKKNEIIFLAYARMSLSGVLRTASGKAVGGHRYARPVADLSQQAGRPVLARGRRCAPEGCPGKVGGAGVRGAVGAPARVCGGGPGGRRDRVLRPGSAFVGREGSFRAKSCLYPKRCVNFARILFICMKNG